jgi:large subunit ribosomal protein L24
MKLKKNDQVIVTVGRDRGKKGPVLRVMPAATSVVVEGVNIAKKHVRPGGKYPRGGIIELTKPIATSKVALVCPNCSKATRIGYVIKGEHKDRVCRKCQGVIK